MGLFSEISFWGKSLGHLPIHLKPKTPDEFILLNGVNGNFCLDLSKSSRDENSYFSKAWSSNTKNFLSVKDDKILLYNWSKQTKVEDIPLKTVENNFDKFYSYLLSKSYRSDRDVVPAIIDIFKQFRTLTTEYRNPVQALNLLFILLASLEDEKEPNKIDKNKWQISDITVPQGFSSFIERFNQSIGNIVPDLNLILRHSAGTLFQEAQKEVIFFDNQLDLFGTFLGKNQTKDILYSSIHYTPSYLARTIVENALNLLDLQKSETIKILDPACGSSEFLIEALKQLKEKDFKGNIQITGYDSSETAVATSLFLLKYEQRTNWGKKLNFQVEIVDDSLTKQWDNDYDIIAMNPPFISWELLQEKDKREAVRNALETNFKGKPNQASAFFYKAVNHIKAEGIIGCVIPSSLFTLDSYLSLRNEVAEIVNIELLGKLGNFVFEDALTDVSIFIGQKPKKNNNTPTLLWTRNEKGIVHDALRGLRKMQYNNEVSKNTIDFSIYKPSQFPVIENLWKPISFGEHNLIKGLKLFIAGNRLSTVGTIFNVSQGIRTGNQKVFKISQMIFDKLSVNEKKYFRRVIDNDSIKNGILDAKGFIWYPYNDAGAIFSTEDEIEANSNYFFSNFLLPNKAVLSQRSGITFWWELTRPRNWQFNIEKRLVSTEFGNSSSFAIDKVGNCVVERGNAWLPKKKMSNDDLYFYLALFSSPFFDKLLSIYSKQLAGGKWYDLGKKQTKEIPIPNVHLEAVKTLNAYQKLVELGKRLSEGDNYVKSILDDFVSVYYPKEDSF